MNQLEALMSRRPPTPNRPLLGQTVLVVEDSRFACDAMRLLCLKSGARIRRADSLHNARRHLRVYRPGVVIIDIGLPDGSGEELIRDLARATPRVDVLLATSGDPDLAGRALAAGADGFLSKPIDNIAAFQAAILAHLPLDQQPPGPRVVSTAQIDPDPLALRDDLAHVSDLLTGTHDQATLRYATQFLTSIACSCGDEALAKASDVLSRSSDTGSGVRAAIARLSEMLQERLSETEFSL